MLVIENIVNENPILQKYDWPLINSFNQLDPKLRNFLNNSREEKRLTLANIVQNSESHGAFLNNHLGTIYSYFYGYPDSPCYLNSDVDLELYIQEAKLILEFSFIHEWLKIVEAPFFTSQKDAVSHLKNLAMKNSGVLHELFNFIETEASKEAILEFLRLEVLRNEVVDDEVALIVVGLQGNMKKVIVSNLWDECGNGNLTKFHTYWLRQLINSLLDWNNFIRYRSEKQPWFSKISSNSFNSLLFRPQYKFRAYGHFLITEAWVEPHFVKILNGLERVGLTQSDIQIYFSAHTKIDPHHTKEIITAIEYQSPALTLEEIREIVIGAYQAIEANLQQYKRVFNYLKSF
ncbi:MAG: iron-containing redox enzyme family protein [Nostochopsis sp.]